MWGYYNNYGYGPYRDGYGYGGYYNNYYNGGRRWYDSYDYNGYPYYDRYGRYYHNPSYRNDWDMNYYNGYGQHRWWRHPNDYNYGYRRARSWGPYNYYDNGYGYRNRYNSWGPGYRRRGGYAYMSMANDNTDTPNLIPKRGGEIKMSIADNTTNTGFNKVNERLHCDDLPVNKICESVTNEPFYLMSKKQLTKNFESYQDRVKDLDYEFIGYNVRANMNVHILRYLSEMGCGAIASSGKEFETCIKAGFPFEKMLFKGAGKRQSEINMAVANEVLVSIYNEDDLDKIIEASKFTGKKAKTMLRITTDREGQSGETIERELEKIKANSDNVELTGILSQIAGERVYDYGAAQIEETINKIR